MNLDRKAAPDAESDEGAAGSPGDRQRPRVVLLVRCVLFDEHRVVLHEVKYQQAGVKCDCDVSNCSYRRRRNLNTLAPLVPFTFVMAYQADLAYGNKRHRIRGFFKINYGGVSCRL